MRLFDEAVTGWVIVINLILGVYYGIFQWNFSLLAVHVSLSVLGMVVHSMLLCRPFLIGKFFFLWGI